jgi:hypothetical protein
MSDIPDPSERLHSPQAQAFGRAVAYSFAGAPVVAGALFYSAIIHWRLILHTWPSGRHPSPYPIGIGDHEMLVFCFGLLIVCSFPVWMTFVLFIKRFVLPSLRVWPLLVPWAAGLVLWFTDPGGFVSFYFD